jgi:hypothetical protein
VNHNKSDTWRIAEAMKATGNSAGIIAQWKAQVEAWANTEPNDADKAAVRAWLPFWQARPAYTAAELVPIFPVLAVALGLRERPKPPFGVGRMTNELRWTRLPRRQIGDVEYFIVERVHYWRSASQEEFENALR